MRGKLTDEKALRELRGIGPKSIPDWLGLMGDSADGIPGIPSWGAKSSSAVLAHYAHIEPRPFTHEHDRCLRVSDPEDDLGPAEAGQFASLAVTKGEGEFLERHGIGWIARRLDGVVRAS